MKKIIFSSLLLLSLSAYSQVTQRNILMKKYSLEFISQNLIPLNQWKPYPKSSSDWSLVLNPEQITEVIKKGEDANNQPISEITASMAMEFKRSGDREKHGKASFSRRNQLMALIVAESIENKDRFTEKIFNLTWAICEESFWGVPAHISSTGLPDPENPIVDLFAAETAAILGLTDYLIGEKLDKINTLVRKRIYFETNRRILQPIKKWENYGYLSRTKAVNNWNPWIVSNLLMANLCLEKNEKERISNVKDYLFHLDAYLNGLGDDGGCDEGPSYWFAAGASVFDCLEEVRIATNDKINIYDEPLIKNMASYIYKMHISDNYFVNFADADPKVGSPDGLMLYRFGKSIGDDKMMAMGQWAFSKYNKDVSLSGRMVMRTMDNLLFRNRIPKQTMTYKPEGINYISDIQVLTAHTKNGLYLATHGGHNAESHNHNDVGDFIIYANGEPIIIDAGRGNYTARTFSSKRYDLWFTQSNYHNLPIINGYGQKVGRDFEALNVKNTISEKEVSLKMDIEKAFDTNAGIIKWTRNLNLDPIKNKVTLTDEYDLKEKPKNLEQVLMTICDIDLSEAGKIILTTPKKQILTIKYDPKTWAISKDIPSTEGMEYESFKTKWDNRPVQRILLSNLKLDQKSTNSFYFELK
jgi:hypothetical protein